ncbi:Myosin-13 [Diplonema papillatum]|nr:Myosin-13 [Diplonema papillatum]
MALKAGALVFYNDPKDGVTSWAVGTCVEVGKKVTTRNVEDGSKHTDLHPQNVVVAREDLLDEDVNDLLLLTILHDATLLRCLRLRYYKDVVYTNIGAIVVALNPFNYKIPHYADAAMPAYLSEGAVIKKNLPHSWGVANNTYWEMINDQRNQCILVSGESGAGKTEAAKIVMKYLSAVSCLRGSDAQKEAARDVGVKILNASPILEAFGNAKTVRNDNSSRFGKFSKVKFDAEGYLVANHTTKYLLEKSRIITASRNERVYHAFYLAVKGKDAASFRLGAAEEYKSLTAGSCVNIEGVNDEEDYAECLVAMEKVGLTQAEAYAAWRLVGGILHFQNVVFEANGDAAKIASNTIPELELAVGAFMVDGAVLHKELLTTTRNLKGEIITSALKRSSAADGRDALSKVLYDGIFSWLVAKINTTTDLEGDSNWIGLLDIFGFEDFDFNSFEQVCINLANEALQNHYNTFIFEKDMKECESEGIDVSRVECPDNSPCLRLITGKLGLFELLDEECALGEGTDMAFLSKLEDHCKGKNPFFDKKRLATTSFIVKHYASDVSYEVDGFREKNMDPLKDSMKHMMRASRCPFTRSLISEPLIAGGRKVTVTMVFKQQLTELLALINTTNPHWIRCIKPHPNKKPRHFHGVSVMNQLSSSGVLGTVKIRKAGYPVRIPFDSFLRRYRICAPSAGHGKEGALAVLHGCQFAPAVAQVGATKVFLKSECFQELEVLREEALSTYARRLQRVQRGWRGRFDTFMQFVVVNAERILREQAEREARERDERERTLRAEADRIALEASQKEERERRKRDEELRHRTLWFNSARCVQRRVRGMLARMRTSRMLVEMYRAQHEARVEARMEAERKQADVLEADRLFHEQACLRDLAVRKAKMVEDAKQKERRERREFIAQQTRERLESKKQPQVSAEELRRAACDLQSKRKQEQQKAEDDKKKVLGEQAASNSNSRKEWDARRRKREKYFEARSAASDHRMDELSELYIYKRAVEHDLKEQHKDNPAPPVGPLPASQLSQLAKSLKIMQSPGVATTKGGLRLPYCVTPEVLSTMSERFIEAWQSKPGDILDELVANLSFPASPNSPTSDYVLILKICERLEEQYGKVHPGKTPLSLLLMRLLTQSGDDTDRMLTWKDAPAVMDPDVAKDEYRRKQSGRRNDGVFEEISQSLAALSLPEHDPHANLEAELRWIKAIGLIIALSEPLPVGKYGAPLVASLGHQPWEVVDYYRQLKPGHVLGIPSVLSCTKAPADRHAASPAKSCVQFSLAAVQEGLYLGALSQYPGEDEVVVPPFSVFSVSDSKSTPGGVHISAQCATVLGSYTPDMIAFRTSVLEDLGAAEGRLRKIKEMLVVHEQLKTLPTRPSQRLNPGAQSSSSAAYFELSKRMWQEREDWTQARDAVLAKEWDSTQQREQNARKKQHVVQNASLQMPPSAANVGPSPAMPGASPSLLSKQYRELERDYQQRIGSFVNSKP